MEKEHGAKIPRELRGSLDVRVCGWLMQYPTDSTNTDVLGIMNQSVEGFTHPHICGKVLTSADEEEVLAYDLPDSKMFVHLKYLCPHHRLAFHSAVEERVGLTEKLKNQQISDISADESVCPQTGKDLRKPRCSKVSAALERLRKGQKKTDDALKKIEKGNVAVAMAAKGEAKKNSGKEIQKKRKAHLVVKKKSFRKRKKVMESESEDSIDSDYFSATSSKHSAGNESKEKEEDCIEIPVCSHHSKPSAFQCCYIDGNRATCWKAICSTCFMERPAIFQQLRHIDGWKDLKKISTVLCVDHFKDQATALFNKTSLTNWEYIYDVSVFNDIKNDGVNMNEPHDISSSLVAAPFASMHSLPTGTGEDMKVAHLSPVAKKSKYVEDIIKCNTFGLEKILTLATSAEYLIPEEMSDLRVGYRNQKFLERFVGVCIWKHMNGNNCWVKPSSFDPSKNEENNKIFNYHIACLKGQHTSLWKKLNDHGVHDIDISKLGNFCHNIKSSYKRYGCWNQESSDKNGVYEKYCEMLKKIDFPFE